MLHTLASLRLLGDEGCLGGQYPQHIPLELSTGLADHQRVVDKPVLSSVSIHIEHLEESLLCSEDLHGEGGVFDQVHETACVSNQAAAHQIAD